MKTPVCLDYSATTPVDPAVLQEMLPYFTENFGNASSHTHQIGISANNAIEKARISVARLINADPNEIVFTAGATEADNMAILGIAEKYATTGDHIITCVTEHKGVLAPCKYLQKKGFSVTYLPVDHGGMIDLGQLKDAITERTILISLMAGNNEIGTLHPMAQIGKIARQHNIPFHTDATQAIGKSPIDVKAMNIDLLSLSGHKIYAPKGIGALYVRNDPAVTPNPIIHGGGHENGLRSGTLNTPGIIGLAKACDIYLETATQERTRLKTLADRLYNGIKTNLPDVSLNGHPENRMTHILNLRFDDMKAAGLMLQMPDLAISSGSACSSAENAASYVILALGIPDNIACGSIRYSLGRFTTQEQIDFAIETTTNAVKALRKMKSLKPPVEAEL